MSLFEVYFTSFDRYMSKNRTFVFRPFSLFPPLNAAKDQKDGDLLAANQLLPQQAYQKSALGALAQQTQSFGKSHKRTGRKNRNIYLYTYSYLKVLNSVLCNAWNCGTCLQSVLRQMTIYDGNIHYCPWCTRLFLKGAGGSRFLGVRILFVYFIHICQPTYDPSMYQVLCLISAWWRPFQSFIGGKRGRKERDSVRCPGLFWFLYNFRFC